MITALTQENIKHLLPLWKEYQLFYQVADIDEERNLKYIQHILDNPQEGRISLYIKNNTVLGFSTLYFTYASTLSSKVAVLNDLFVMPQERGNGIGKALLEHAIEMTQELKITHIRWVTQSSNENAQQLYKNYSKPSEWLSYAIKVM